MTETHQDKRSVFTDALETLGNIIDDNQRRDAIHLAVEPVQAKELLIPGQHVDATGNSKGKHVGIVDPFLRHPINPGEWFWLVVYPRQINSLRHVWTHPDFPNNPDLSTEDLKTHLEKFIKKEINLFPSSTDADDKDIELSKKWMEDYANSLEGMIIDAPYNEDRVYGEVSYDELMEATKKYLLQDKYFKKGALFSGKELHPEFWDHYEILTGTKVNEDKRHSFFTCSC